MFVRNPLERLLSAFINKLSSPIDIKTKVIEFDTFGVIKQQILNKYQFEKVQQGLENGITKFELDFETYLKWIIDTPKYKLNEHFAPLVELSQPCRMKYNFYGNFKMFSSDMKAITTSLGVPHEWFVGKAYHQKGRDTKNLVVLFYSAVSKDTKQRLVKAIWKDLDFYYTLFPKENGSHFQLLGLKEP